MNASRPGTYAAIRAGIASYIEARIRLRLPVREPRDRPGAGPMDVALLDKGKGLGKAKGKGK
eukprot:9583008-Heterocapsa_arctica.AAC.1